MSNENLMINVDSENQALKVKAVKQLFEKTSTVGNNFTAGSTEKRSVKKSSTIELLQKKLHPSEDVQQNEPCRSGDIKQLRLQNSRPKCTWTCGTLSGVARKRSKSRFSTSPRKVYSAAPSAKRERPYRQWLGVSSCVTADSKFIISSKPSRHSLGKDGSQSVTGEINTDAHAVANIDSRSRESVSTDQSSICCSITREVWSNVGSSISNGVRVSDAETDLTAVEASNRGGVIKSCGMTSCVGGETSCVSNKESCPIIEKTTLCGLSQSENGASEPVLFTSTAESGQAKAMDTESSVCLRYTPPFIDPESSTLISDDTLESSTVLYMTSSLNSDNDTTQCSDFSCGKSHSLEDDNTDNLAGGLSLKNAKKDNCGSSLQKEGEDKSPYNKDTTIKTSVESMTKNELNLHDIRDGTPSSPGLAFTHSAGCACNTSATKSSSFKDLTKSPMPQSLITRELSDILGDVASNQDTSEVHLSDLSWQEATDDDSLESEHGFRILNAPGSKSGYQSGNRRMTWRSRMEKSASLKSTASLRLQEHYRLDFTARARELTRPVRKKGIITTAHLDQKTPQHSTAEISYIKGLSTPETKRKQSSVSPCIAGVPNDKRPLLRTAARACQRSRQESPCANNSDTTPYQRRGPANNAGAKQDSTNQKEREQMKTVCSIGTETELGQVIGPAECSARQTKVCPDFKTSDTLRRARNNSDAVHLAKHNKHKSVGARQLLQKISWTSKNEQKPEYKMVQAIVDFRGTLPGQLSFRKGQIIRQRCETENQASDLCYGSYSVGRLKKKRKGLFPAYCVVDYCPSN